MVRNFYIVAYYINTLDIPVKYKMIIAESARAAKKEVESSNPDYSVCMVAVQASPDEWQ